MILRYMAAGIAAFAIAAHAAEPQSSALSGPEIAKRVRELQRGTTYMRAQMQVPGKRGRLQLQIKTRASESGTEIVYQVLYPRERKGEAVLLRRAKGRLSGTLFTPPDRVSTIEAAHFSEPLFGSDLSYEDAIDDVYAWERQAIVGTEVIDRVDCHILESKPGKSQRSSFSRVRTWVDAKRFVPLRVEKYAGGDKLVRRIRVTRVSRIRGDHLPSAIRVRGSDGSVTTLSGARFKRGVKFTDAEFTPEGLRTIRQPNDAKMF